MGARGQTDETAAAGAASTSTNGTIESEARAIAHDVQLEVTSRFVAEGRSPFSPEARKEAERITAQEQRAHGVLRRSYARIGPGTRGFNVAKRVVFGTYFDGFIHAGNLAYLTLIALFPFFITAAALVSFLGLTPAMIEGVERGFAYLPRSVADTLEGPVHQALAARTGPLLWIGGLVGMWTVGSLIETVRDILRRAYGTRARKSFFHYRLYSIGLIVGAVVLMMVAFSMQVVIVAAEEVIQRLLPAEVATFGDLAFTRLLTIGAIYLSLFLLFVSLTPQAYRGAQYPKWPGAVATTLWWVGVTAALPPLLATLFAYDKTYGSLAGVMISLFFFYLIGLGVVIGAELNAALAPTPGARNELGQADDRARALKKDSEEASI